MSKKTGTPRLFIHINAEAAAQEAAATAAAIAAVAKLEASEAAKTLVRLSSDQHLVAPLSLQPPTFAANAGQQRRDVYQPSSPLPIPTAPSGSTGVRVARLRRPTNMTSPPASEDVTTPPVAIPTSTKPWQFKRTRSKEATTINPSSSNWTLSTAAGTQTPYDINPPYDPNFIAKLTAMINDSNAGTAATTTIAPNPFPYNPSSSNWMAPTAENVKAFLKKNVYVSPSSAPFYKQHANVCAFAAYLNSAISARARFKKLADLNTLMDVLARNFSKDETLEASLPFLYFDSSTAFECPINVDAATAIFSTIYDKAVAINPDLAQGDLLHPLQMWKDFNRGEHTSINTMLHQLNMQHETAEPKQPVIPFLFNQDQAWYNPDMLNFTNLATYLEKKAEFDAKINCVVDQMHVLLDSNQQGVLNALKFAVKNLGQSNNGLLCKLILMGLELNNGYHYTTLSLDMSSNQMRFMLVDSLEESIKYYDLNHFSELETLLKSTPVIIPPVVSKEIGMYRLAMYGN